MTETKIDFPQPEVEAPKVGDQYYFVFPWGKVASEKWGGGQFDQSMLQNGSVYLTEAEAEQRAAWNRQDMARRVVPKWLRDLGTDIQKNTPDGWLDVKCWFDNFCYLDPADFRAKPKPAPDVVVNVNGREYRWPATVKEGEPQGVRYSVALESSGDCYKVFRYLMVHAYGPRRHHTREGAEAQCAALNAALGIEQGGAA